MSELEGGCACGAVRFKISGDLMGGGVCHCRACQYSTGGPPGYVVLAPRAGFSVTKGQPRTYTAKADSGNDVRRVFCADCGTPLYTETTGAMPFLPVKAGALDDPKAFKPQIHLYMDDAQPWHLTHDGLPQFPRMPPMG